jgi:hypothetical protein
MTSSKDAVAELISGDDWKRMRPMKPAPTIVTRWVAPLLSTSQVLVDENQPPPLLDAAPRAGAPRRSRLHMSWAATPVRK